MSDDRALADLLGDAPAAPDAAFRFDVFARVALRAQRRRTLRRAAMQGAAWTGMGVMVSMAQAIGFTGAELTQLVNAAGMLLAAGAMALLAIEGPAGLASRSRELLNWAR